VFLETEGYRVIRFTNQQVFENVEAASEEISQVLGGGG
jgi:very-short-patch-repair endonuclease